MKKKIPLNIVLLLSLFYGPCTMAQTFSTCDEVYAYASAITVGDGGDSGFQDFTLAVPRRVMIHYGFDFFLPTSKGVGTVCLLKDNVNYPPFASGGCKVGRPPGSINESLVIDLPAGNYRIQANATSVNPHGDDEDMVGTWVWIDAPKVTPTIYTVTGGGSSCAGGNTIPIGLDGSDAGMAYGLYRDGVFIASYTSSGGGPFSFGSFNIPGTYTIATIDPCIVVQMSNSAVISPAIPSALQAWNNGIAQRYFCYASPAPVATLTATYIPGAVYHWYNPDTGWSFTSTAGDNDTQINAPQGSNRYYVYVTINGCTSNTAFTDVEVKPFLPSVNASHNTPVCVGQNLNLHADNAGGVGTYSWTGPNGFTSSAQHPVITNVSAAHAGTYTVTLVNEQCSGAPSSTTVALALVATAGSIGSSQTICSGATPAALMNVSNGTNGTYQWQSSPNGSSWSNISGATGSAYAPGALSSTTYYKRLTISSCNTAETTPPVVITVTPLPVAGTIAVSGSSTICSGTAVSFTNATSGANGTYQWQSSPNGTTWTNISGATNAIYTTPALTENISYRRNVVSATCSIASTTAVNIVVQPLPVAGTIGSPQTICSGATPAVLTNGIGGANGTYQWQSSPNGTTWTNVSGAMAATYAPGALTATTHYRRNVISTNCGTVSTTSVIITVTPLPVAGEIEANQTICAGIAPSQLTNKTSGVNGTYQWESSTTAGTTWVAVSGATEATYQPPVLSSTTLYRRNTTSGCGVASSVAVTITVIPLPVAGAIGGGPQTICSGSTPDPLTDVTSGVGTYQWQLSTNAGSTWSDIAGATGATYVPGALAVTTHYRRGSTSCNSTVYTTAVVVTIHPPAAAGQIGGAQTLCSGSIPTALTNVTSGFNIYQWQLSTDGGSTWNDITGVTSATYAPGALTATTHYKRNASSCGTTMSSNVIIKAVTQPQKADFTYSGTPYCAWNSAKELPADPVVTFINGGVAGEFSVSSPGLSINIGTGVVNLKQSNSGVYTITNTIAAAGGCPVVTKTATLEIRPKTTFTINEIEENGIRNYYIEQAASDPGWAAEHTYNWWYINVKPRRVNATDDNYPWMTVGMFQPLSFVLDIVTDESLIIDVKENSTGCITRVELGRDVVDGTIPTVWPN